VSISSGPPGVNVWRHGACETGISRTRKHENPPMPFDALTMAAVADEIRDRSLGGQIQKIIQPSGSSVALSIYFEGDKRWLVMSADPRYARVSYSADRLAKAFPTPSSFVMLLRKHLEGVRVVDVERVAEERILSLTCGPPEHRVRLVAEVMAKHSNVLLLDMDDRILGAIKIIPPRLSRVRPILPGHAYQPPPVRDRDTTIALPGPRPDPVTQTLQLRSLIRSVPTETTVGEALIGLLPGSSPFLVVQIASRAGINPRTLVEEADVDALVGACVEMYGLYQTHEWQPCTFIDARGREDFAPYLPVDVTGISHVDSISQAVDHCFGTGETRDALATTRKDVSTQLERAKRGVERRIQSLNEGLDASAEANTVKERGQLLLAYQWAAEPRAGELRIPDLDLTIQLDPSLSVKENAERIFRRYHKLRDAARRIPELIVEAEAEQQRLHDLDVFIRLADSEGTLRDLQREISGPPQESKKQAARKKRGPLRFRYDGFVAVLGRNARENEEVTFRLARRQDLWMHARERTGTHLVLQGNGEPPPEVLESAAALAAYFSEGREDTRVDVDVAAVRDVRKIPGGAPGRVTYRNFRTITVPPGQSGWEPEKRKK
jgi:predicted ribosome quality control (RQC) complex YloA/Tae2 family protein